MNKDRRKFNNLLDFSKKNYMFLHESNGGIYTTRIIIIT